MVSLPPCRPPPHCRTLFRRGHSPWALHPTPPKCGQSRTAETEFAHPRALHRIPRRNTTVHTARGLCTPPHPSADRAAPPRLSLRTRGLFTAYPAATPPFTEHGDICTPPPTKCGQSRTAGVEFACPRANCKTDGCLSAL